jgi:hypothetical protein
MTNSGTFVNSNYNVDKMDTTTLSIDFAKITTLIDLLSGIGTFIASVIAVYTLVEVRRQRKDALKPHLLFGKGTMATCILKNPTTDFKYHWKVVGVKEIEEDFVCFEILNVGNGVAESVILIEDFDAEQAIQLIRKLDKKNEFAFKKGKNGYDFDATSKTADGVFQYFPWQSKINTRNFNYIVTSQQQPGNYKFAYDDFYLILVSCFLHLSEFPPSNSIEEFPHIKFTLKYKDIHGNKYEKKFQNEFYPIKPDTISISINPS